MEKILIVEDNKAMRDMLFNILSEKKYQVTTAPDVSTAILLLKKEHFHIILSDFQLPDMDGLTFFKKVKHLKIPFIILTAFGSIELAVEAMKEGAFHFISKPVDPDYLFLLIKKALQSTRLERENIIFKEIYAEEMHNPVIIGNSKIILKIADDIKKVAPTNAPVLLLGESGTGKELFARTIHNLSRRKTSPFIAINSASIPENLLENELFGHERGSFTDAYIKQIGKFELSQKGSFFMDEIGDLPLSLQGKILRVVEEKRITRLGSNHEIDLDIRFIFATNKNLEEEVKNSKFRRDLFFRINVFPVTLPPLRERGEDILLLGECFLNRFSREIKNKNMTFAQGTREKLLDYQWPGNIRELMNTIERAVITSTNDVIKEEDIILSKKSHNIIEELNLNGNLKSVTRKAVKTIEKIKIKEVLEQTNYNKKKTAGILGISYKSLYSKIRKYDLTEED